MRANWKQIVGHLKTAARHALIVAERDGIAERLRHYVQKNDSRSPVDTLILPDADALAKWMGRPADWTHPADNALGLATAAYRSLAEREGNRRAIGVGIICPHGVESGSDALYVATQTIDETRLSTFGCPLNADDTASQAEAVVDRVLWTLAEAARCDDVARRRPDEHRADSYLVEPAEPLLAGVWTRQRAVVWSTPGGWLEQDPPDTFGGVLSGSFNPLHDGHRLLRAAAQQHLGVPICLELPILNADKPPLDFISIARRRRQFHDETLALTGAATFVEKAAIFPGTTFVVGVDTAERIVDSRFYGNSEDAMQAALRQIDSAGCRFLVAGRLMAQGFVTLRDVALPAGFERMFLELPQQAFRLDMSSTSLRRERQ